MKLRQLCAKGHHYLIFEATEYVPSDYITTNRTYVDWVIKMEVTQNWYFDDYMSRLVAKINGETVYDTEQLRGAMSTGENLWASGRKEVYHNADGRKTVELNCDFTEITGNYYTPGDCHISSSMALSTIPRATTCPNLSGYIEDSYNISLNPASSSFKHSLKVTFGSIDKYINSNGTLQTTEYKFNNSNILFTLPSAFYNEFTGKYKTGTFTLKTYSGTSLIGTKTGVFTANCLESRCKPSISGTLKDINITTVSLTGSENKVIKGYSNIQATLTLTSSSTSEDHSTITSRVINGISFVGNNPIIFNTQSKSVTITVTNSRGFTNTNIISTTGNLIEYFDPQINLNAYRVSQTSSNVKLTYFGKFFNQSFGNISNVLNAKWFYKEDVYNSEWVLGGNITPTFNENNIVETTIDCGELYNYKKNYRFKLSVIDKLSEDTKEQTVTTGIPNHDWGEEHFQHHTPVYDKDANEFLAFKKIKTI